jgi:hypothetical protein
MSFLETALAATIGVAVFYLLEAIYYDIRARIRGKQYEDFWDYIEEEMQD